MSARVVLAHRHGPNRRAIAAALIDAGVTLIQAADLEGGVAAARGFAPCTLMLDLSLLRDGGDSLGEVIARLRRVDVICLGAEDDASARTVRALGAAGSLPSAASDEEYRAALAA
jgi:DNA-binding NarL/FixJ family response regulator